MCKLFVAVCLFTASLWSQAALVSANFRTVLSDAAPARSKITFRLKNYGTSIPRITSGPLAGVVVQTARDVTPDTAGVISTLVYRNDFIDPPDTWWSVEYYYNERLTSAQTYTFTANQVDLDSYPSLSMYPVPPVAAPPTAVLTNPPGGSQQNVAGPLSMTQLIVNPGNSSVMGNSSTPSVGVILRVDNTFTNPDTLAVVESRGVSVVNRRTQSLAESAPADQFGVLGAVTIEAGTTQNIAGQMKASPSEIYLQHPTVGAYTVTTALNYFASFPALETGATLTNWYGLRVNDPCRVGGGGCTGTFAGGGSITNGYAIYLEGVTSPPVTNRAAIKINAQNQDGSLEWTAKYLQETTDGQSVKEIITNGPIQVGVQGGTVAQLRLPYQTTVDGTHPTLDASIGALQAKAADGHLYWCRAGTCSDLVPAAAGTGFANGGNAFGGTAVLGTTDNNRIDIEANLIVGFTVDPNGGNTRLLGGITSSDLVTLKGSVVSKDAVCTASANTNAAVGCLTNSGGNIIVSSNHSGVGTTGDLLFSVPTEAVRIDHTTKAVGIGTGASPARALHVKDAANNTQLRLQGPAPGGAGAGLELYESGTFEASVRVQSSSTDGFNFISQAGVPIVFFPSAGQMFRLTSTGAIVGTGTTTPYTLHVNGPGKSETCGGGCVGAGSQLAIQAGANGNGISFLLSDGVTLNGLISSSAANALVLSNEVANALIAIHHVGAQVGIGGVLQLTKDTTNHYAFATLPVVLRGGVIFCSDCKKIADGAAAGSIAAGGGTGTHLGSDGTNWRIMY